MKTLKNINLSAFLASFALLALVFSASYAFFTSYNNANVTYNTSLGGGANLVYTLTMKNNLTLNVDPHVLSNGGQAYQESNVTTDNVTLVNNENKSVTCKYNIIFEPTTAFKNSTNNTANELEFALIGSKGSGMSDADFTQDLNGVSSKMYIKQNVEITAAAKTTVTHNWKFYLVHYNLDVNQNNLMGKSFSGKVRFEALDCE